tara:strand:+ start:102 stop:974 length:873 start_codon:yes stop_codon:yes gene_type:complete
MYKDQFLNYLKYERNFSPNTIKSYFNDLDQFFSFVKKESKIIKHVSLKDIRNWIILNKEIGLESSTINRKISCLRTYFRFLGREGFVSNNPTNNINLLSIKKRLPVFVSEDSMHNLFSAMNFPDDFSGKRDAFILDLFYQTGLRLSELINIKIGDLDVKKKTLRIFGKGSKERVVPILDVIINRYKEYMISRKEISSKFLFVTSSGKKAYPKMVYRIVNKYLSAISTITKKSPHILRHTFATHLLNRGADINTIKELLGHKTLSSTQVYTHNSLDKIKKIYKKSHPRGGG